MDQRRNDFCFLVEGAFFIGGVGFVNGQTLLPAMILREGGPAWLAALAPSMMVLGLFSAPVFTARIVDGMTRMKPMVMWTALVMRLVYLTAALLFLLPGLQMEQAVWILALTPFLAGFAGGIGITAWQRLFSAAVPAKRRPTNIAFRFMIGGVLGVVAGRTIEWSLQELPVLQAFAFLHFLAFAFFMLSLVVLGLVREPASVDGESMVEPKVGGSALLQGVRDQFAPGPERRSRISFFAALILMHGVFLTTPFLAAHLLEILEKPDAFLGVLAMWQMGGMAIGNLLAAWLGSRWGSRFILGLGGLVLAGVLLTVPLIRASEAACVMYATYAVSIMLMIVGKDSLLLDMTPKRGQSRYLTVMAVTTMVALLSASMGGYFIRLLLRNFELLARIGACFGVACFLATSYIREPREDVRGDPIRALCRGVLRYFR